MFVMDCYGHKLSNGVLFAHHLILDAPGGSSHLGYRRRVPLWHNPPTRVKRSPAVRARKRTPAMLLYSKNLYTLLYRRIQVPVCGRPRATYAHVLPNLPGLMHLGVLV